MAILIKKSNTPSALPSVVYGELAVNTYDQKLWVGSYANTRILLADGGGTGTGEIDGGTVASVYLASQVITGGNASGN